MLEEPSSLRDLVRNPLAWLGVGGLALGLFVLFPQLPASLEIALLCALMVLLGATAGEKRQQRARQSTAVWSHGVTAPAACPHHLKRGREALHGCRRLYVGEQLTERCASERSSE
jgi:hypothetical protein